MTDEMRQRYAVAALTGACEGLISAGLLNPMTEMRFRDLVAETLAAFHMPSRSERTVPIQTLDHTLRLVAAEMSEP
jgi:hypothetical protein